MCTCADVGLLVISGGEAAATTAVVAVVIVDAVETAVVSEDDMLGVLSSYVRSRLFILRGNSIPPFSKTCFLCLKKSPFSHTHWITCNCSQLFSTPFMQTLR